MTNTRSTRPERSAKARPAHSALPPVESNPEPRVIRVERSGDWMPADELRESALVALSRGKGLTLDLDGIEYLDASALQILLAVESETEKCGQSLRLVKTSAHLRKWFELAGVWDRFFHDRAEEG